MDQEKIKTLKADTGRELHETIDQLIAAHGEIAVVRTAMGVAIFRKPRRMEYKRHLSMLFNEKQRADAVEALARDCVVHPEKTTFAEWLESKPGIPIVCSDALTKLAGGAKDEDEGK